MAYKTLSLSPLENKMSFCRPSMTYSEEKISLDAPAKTVMTDLTRVSAVTASPMCSIVMAHDRMIANGVRMLIITDQKDHILGLVTDTDINGEKPMSYIREVGGSHDEVVTRDIMTPKEKLEAMSMNEINNSTVGDVVETLKSVGRQHALVMNEETGRICGIFSSSQIIHLTGKEIDLSAKSGDFSELQSAIS
ncbi:MAG: CBS domain-containing protein [Gammaproteobacteria bacterium]|nr:CBS domain-containing protein [Gammaproteobacteria bacterium]